MTRNMGKAGRRILSRLPALAVLFGLVPGCSLDVQTPQALLWEADVEPTTDDPGLTGSAAAISRETSTEVGIEVRGGTAGNRWVWRIRRGSCEAPDASLAEADAFPVLEAEDTSEPGAPSEVVVADGETFLSTTLDSNQSYHVTVAAEGVPDELLACGDFELG